MKRKLFVSSLVVVFALSVSLNAQESKLSLSVQHLNQAYSKHQNEIFEPTNFSTVLSPYAHNDVLQKVDVIVKATPKFESELAQLNLSVNSTIGDYYTLHISPDELKKLSELTSVEYIDLVPKPGKRLKKARGLVNADKVQAGTGLKSKYDGSGVVVGVIDYDFDFTHPAFYTKDGSQLRIKRAWMQDVTGVTPGGFNYGHEVKTQASILAEEYTNNSATHGTHVAGIAAGSGYGSVNYTGIAPNADLVFVEGENTADALNYIFNYSKSVKKPCVVNMSLGTHLGPHDGTSTLDKVIDQLSTEGQIIVGAAGNEGETKLHIEHNFSGDTIYTYPRLDYDTEGQTSIDIWGEKGKSFSIALSVYSYVTQSIIFTSDYIPTSFNGVDDTTIQIGQDQAYLAFGAESSSPLNQKSHANIEYSISSDDMEVYLIVTASNGKVHMWNNTDGSGGPFTNVDATGVSIPGFVKGDTDVTIGEIGGTAKEIIAVGAYTSDNSITTLNSNTLTTPETNGAIANFSSKGPTVDGRIRPHITGPGNYVVAAFNSHTADVRPGGGREDEIVASTTVGGKTYYYGGLQGTSMATPAVTGVVALMLDADSSLTPEKVKDLMAKNAITDGFTGTIPSAGNNTWGHGKIDAHAMLKKIEEDKANNEDPVSVLTRADLSSLKVFPNPVNDKVTIEAQGLIHSVRIFDLTGKVVFEPVINSATELVLSTAELHEGVYLMEVSTAVGTDVVRIVKR